MSDKHPDPDDDDNNDDDDDDKNDNDVDDSNCSSNNNNNHNNNNNNNDDDGNIDNAGTASAIATANVDTCIANAGVDALITEATAIDASGVGGRASESGSTEPLSPSSASLKKRVASRKAVITKAVVIRFRRVTAPT